MVEFTRKNSPYLILVVLLEIFLTGCAHKKAYKKAVEYEKAGRYVEAAEKDLEALRKKSEYTDALMHLQQVAPKAYEELLAKSENHERNFRWIDAVNTWSYLDRILNQFQRHDVTLATVNISSRLLRAKEKGKNYYYNNAQQYFQSGAYLQAIDQFKKVSQIAGYYLETKEKLWKSYIRLGDDKLSNRQFEPAVNYYKSALEYAIDRLKTKEYMAEAYYRWAKKLAMEDNYREATETFEKVLQIIPEYRDTEEQRQIVYEKAVRRIAILPFRNSTPYGAQYSNLLTEEIINNCIKSNLKYAVFITRANLDQILEEYKLAMAGVVDPSKASEIGKLEGIHYFITGNITQISEQTSSPAFVEKTHEKTYTEKDTAGNDITKTQTIFYREYKARRTVQIATSYQIVDVETGRYVSGDNYSEKVTDEARWIRYHGSVYDLPRQKQKLMDSSTEPKSADILINDGIRRIARRISQRVVEFYK